MKLIGVLALALIASACSTTPKPIKYFDVQNKRFFIASVDVNLLQKCDSNPDGFADHKALAKKFKEKLQKVLWDKKILAFFPKDAVTLKLKIQYRRNFMGEMFGICKTYGSSTLQYSGTMIENGHHVASDETKEIITLFNASEFLKQVSGASVGSKNLVLEDHVINDMSLNIVKWLYLFQDKSTEPSK
ncbi:hypothetical protein I8J31_19410 [Marinomonas sp. C1424]|uniref:Uncharacterized protein n=2 Tax=Marinomonas transparens TaxID=2795388 RepID=A0A934MXZ2_9GAMM|nr:hypothetical protein [Marinomonas transparens]